VRFFGAPTHELSTKALLVRLMENLEAETPVKLHEGPDHIDAGGVPAMTAAFLGHLDSGPNSTVQRPDKDAILAGTYRRPMAAAIDSMLRCTGKVAWWGRIVERILYAGEHARGGRQGRGEPPVRGGSHRQRGAGRGVPPLDARQDEPATERETPAIDAVA
jgi:hypothetical protein